MRKNISFLHRTLLCVCGLVFLLGFIDTPRMFAYYNKMDASVVLGQPDFTSNTADNGGISCATLTNTATGVNVTSNGRLMIGDGARVLIFNQFPASNFQPADIVLGQPGCVSRTINNGGIGNSSLGLARSALEIGKKLFVSDQTNNRILIFNDTTNFPRLGLTSIGSSPDPLTTGRLRVTGNMYVDGGLYNLWKVETSVNGGDYASVASLDHSIQINSNHDPGKTDTVTSSFYSDFEPWNLQNNTEGNGTKSQWLSDFNSMLRDQGYLLKLKATNNNADSGFPLVYFLPFSITNPTNSSTGIATDKTIPIISSDPSISFKVNPNFRNEFKENIDDYQVWYQPLKYDPATNAVLPPMDTDWNKYIDSIPSDYDLVRDSELNKNQGSYDGTKDTGNGTYLTDTLSVKYTNNSSTIQVRKIGNQENTIPREPTLNPGTYRLRISAIDKHGHGEDTEAVVVEVK